MDEAASQVRVGEEDFGWGRTLNRQQSLTELETLKCTRRRVYCLTLKKAAMTVDCLTREGREWMSEE